MDRAERLAAYVADELSPDERRALEADLAGDAALRADLEAMRRADAALAAAGPTALPDGARDRLLAALDPVLREELADGAAGPVVVDAADQLAARRRRRDARRTWGLALGGVAAALVAVAVVLPSLGGFGGADDAAESDVAATLESGDAGGAAEAPADDGALALPAGPTVTDSGRDLDAAGADELLAAGELEAVVAAGLPPEEAALLAGDWASALGADAGARALAAEPLPEQDATGDAAEAADDGAEAADTETEESPDEDAAADRTGAVALYGAEVDDAARADVGRCLDVLLSTGDLAVPVTAELVRFDGEDAIAFGLVGLDADGQVTRREVWVLSRATCEVRYFSQG